MEYIYVVNKILRRLSLWCSLPRLREKYLEQKYSKIFDVRAFDNQEIKKILVQSYEKEETLRIKERAESIRGGNHYIFCEPAIQRKFGVFLTHPRTGRKETLAGWCRSTIDYDGDEDIKFLWELNRLGDLDALIAVSIIENDPSFLETAQDIVRQWQDENPFGYGVNWYSNMEVALRLMRLLFLRAVGLGFQREQKGLLRIIHDHWIHVFADWKSTRKTMKGGNHLLAEVASLAVYECLTGTQGPGCKNLVHECERQFHEDGGYFEGTLGYHIYVLYILIFMQIMTKGAGITSPLPSSVMKKAVRFVYFLVGPDGSVPGIGDWDDGYVFKPVPENTRIAKNLIRLARNLNMIHGDEETSWHQKWKIFPKSGMAVHKWEGQGTLCFRAASVLHGHSHLDMLALIFISNEGPVILDGGTYAYNYSRGTRNFYRSPEAHSTLFEKGVMPLQPLRGFAWKGFLKCRMWGNGSGIVGEYYIQGKGPLRREVKITNDGYQIRDYCQENANAWCQYLVPGAESTEEGIMVKNHRGEPVLLIGYDCPQSEIHMGHMAISSCYGEKHNVISVCFPVYQNLLTELTFFK